MVPLGDPEDRLSIGFPHEVSKTSAVVIPNEGSRLDVDMGAVDVETVLFFPEFEPGMGAFWFGVEFAAGTVLFWFGVVEAPGIAGPGSTARVSFNLSAICRSGSLEATN